MEQETGHSAFGFRVNRIDLCERFSLGSQRGVLLKRAGNDGTFVGWDTQR